MDIINEITTTPFDFQHVFEQEGSYCGKFIDNETNEMILYIFRKPGCKYTIYDKDKTVCGEFLLKEAAIEIATDYLIRLYIP